MQLVEVVEDKGIVWQVLDNYFNFTQDKNEWIGNRIIFEIGQKDGKTLVTFTHQGLVPGYECYTIAMMPGRAI